MSVAVSGQHRITGTVMDSGKKEPIPYAEVYIEETQELNYTDVDGHFVFEDLPADTYHVTAFVIGYDASEHEVLLEKDQSVNFELEPFGYDLSEIVIQQKRAKNFTLNRLKSVEGTHIYEGKKSEVVLVDQAIANLATNNARQVFSQVAGLNIYENNDAGLQLNIGGRGLDPNRSAHFNIRQNGYDISADVLGYPESYYTPPTEALREIQIVRGAASLQYGTQFGGLVNFIMKKPHPVKKLEWTSRQTAGSFGLLTSFNSLSGTLNKFSYYTYFNYKQGDGFRPNSDFNSRNFYGSFRYSLNSKTHIILETSFLNYMAQQPGGLTDSQFEDNIFQSNRSRNYFSVDWKLYALKLEHALNNKTDLSLTLFGLDAERKALGFRGDPKRLERNPITEPDDPSYTRDLISGQFRNWGAEARMLTEYRILGQDAFLLLGGKYYQSRNRSMQGPGPDGSAADFHFTNEQNPSYPNQSDFVFPNLNVALFGENIFQLNKKLSLTPGIRWEYINTASEGTYTQVRYDNAGNEIFRDQLSDNRMLSRSFLLLGIGLSYDYDSGNEFYANISENYRSVTFNDIRTVNPTFLIDPDIRDESGFTADLGYRGQWKEVLSFDLSAFALNYSDRIGTILVQSGPNKGDRVRKNIGDAIIYGVEGFVDWNAVQTLGLDKQQFILNPFVNLAMTHSQYYQSEENNVTGKQVEFIPLVNLKTGIRFGFDNLMASWQFTHLSSQYTDAENSLAPEAGSSREGIIGKIPSYQIMDLSLSYRYRRYKLETGINNLLNEKYFSRRATGYPGPGIIPGDPRSYYVTVEVKF